MSIRRTSTRFAEKMKKEKEIEAQEIAAVAAAEAMEKERIKLLKQTQAQAQPIQQLTQGPLLHKIKYVPRSEIVENCGSYEVIVDFEILNLKSKSVKPAKINGCIFQLIIKDTNAKGSNFVSEKQMGPEVDLNTSDTISKYTNKQVNWMCENYLEYFEIIDGLVKDLDGDGFASGPIARYSKNDPIIDDAENISQGSIIHIGLAVFVPNSAFLDSVKKLKWSTNPRLPANGLPYLRLLGNEPVWNDILLNKTSGIYKHEVRHVWKFIQRENNPDDRIFFESIVEIPDISDAIELGEDTFNSKILRESRQFATDSLTLLISRAGGGKNKRRKNIKNKHTQKYKKKQTQKIYYKK
jgi:hypothetical protein